MHPRQSIDHTADRDGDGTNDTNVIATALLSATEEIDTYLAVRYNLPLSVVPGILTRTCADIAMYLMSIGADSMTDDKETRYNSAVKWLVRLSKGTVTLGPEEEQVSIQDEATVSSDSEVRLFSRTKMRGLL